MLLAMDTATQTASIAVLAGYAEVGLRETGGQLLGEWTWQARRRQTQDLMTAVQDLLVQADAGVDELTAVAVTTGPGSFTGVRIAVSAAKGLELGMGRPLQCVGIPVLCVTAAPWFVPAAQVKARIWACLHAGRGRVNWCVFDGQDPLWRPAAADHQAGTVDELVMALKESDGPVWVVGELPPALHEAVHEAMDADEPDLAHVRVLDAVSGTRRAGMLAYLAAAHLRRNGGDTPDGLQPLYLNTL